MGSAFDGAAVMLGLLTRVDARLKANIFHGI